MNYYVDQSNASNQATGSAEDASVPTTPATHTLQGIEETYTIQASSQEELDMMLGLASQLAGVSIEDLDYLTFSRAFSQSTTELDVKGYLIDVNDNVITFSPELLAKAKQYAGSAFMNGSVPQLHGSTALFSHSRVDLSSTNPLEQTQVNALAGSYAASASQIYEDNYNNSQLPGIELSSLQPGVGQLMTLLFGEPPAGGFTQGHINVLKTLGLVRSPGDVNNPMHWTLTSGPQSLHMGRIEAPLGGDDLLERLAGESQFIAQGSLAELSSASDEPEYNAAINAIDNSLTRFDSNGQFLGAAGLDINILQGDAKHIHGLLKSDETPFAGEVPQDVAEVVNFLVDGSSTNGQINTAIAMGLVQYNQATGQLTLTASGQTVKAEIAKAGETPDVTESPDESNNNQAPAWDGRYYEFSLEGQRYRYDNENGKIYTKAPGTENQWLEHSDFDVFVESKWGSHGLTKGDGSTSSTGFEGADNKEYELSRNANESTPPPFEIKPDGSIVMWVAPSAGNSKDVPGSGASLVLSGGPATAYTGSDTKPVEKTEGRWESGKFLFELGGKEMMYDPIKDMIREKVDGQWKDVTTFDDWLLSITKPSNHLHHGGGGSRQFGFGSANTHGNEQRLKLDVQEGGAAPFSFNSDGTISVNVLGEGYNYGLRFSMQDGLYQPATPTEEEPVT